VPLDVGIELGQKGVQIIGIPRLEARWTVSTFSCDIARPVSRGLQLFAQSSTRAATAASHGKQQRRYPRCPVSSTSAVVRSRDDEGDSGAAPSATGEPRTRS
jgi:hypothetical protein